MRGKQILWLAVPVLALLAAWWLWSSFPDSTGLPVASPSDVVPSAGSGEEQQHAASPSGRDAEAVEETAEASHDLPFDSPMKAQLAQMAEAYRAQNRFPTYSRPLSLDDWQQLNPRGFVAHERPVEGVPDLTLAVRTDYYVNDISQPMTVWVQTTADGVKAQSATLTLRSQSGAASGAVALPMVRDEGPIRVFEGVVPPSQLAAVGAGEVAMVADVKLTDGRSVNGAGVIELYDAIAKLRYLGEAYVEGPNLIIPAHFEVRQQGYYRVQANLYQADTMAPVSHVSAAFVLSESDTTGLLKVHAVTLREKQAAGPYVLKDFNILRSPARPGDLTRFGTAEQSEYSVRGFSLDLYSNEPWVDPQVQQSQEFLDRISGQSGE